MPIDIPDFTRGTDYVEMPGTTLSIENGKLKGQRKFRVINYDNYPLFLAALAGGITVNGSDVVHRPPVKFRTDVDGIYCLSASHEGIGVPKKLADGSESWDGGALVSVTYGTLDYNPSNPGGTGGDPNNPTPGPYMTESGSTAAQVVTRTKAKDDGSAAWKWLSNAKITTESAPDIIAHEILKTYVITRYNVTTYPRVGIQLCAGKVNNLPFPAASSAGIFPAETLRFDGDDFQRETFSDGKTNGWTITLRFSYNPNGWNRLFNPSTGAYEKVLRTADATQSIYETTAFEVLLGVT